MGTKSGILSKGELVNNTYEVQFFIGEGAFGEVYRVKHKYLGLQVLKVIKPEYAKDTDINVIVNEAKILSALNHDHIVRVFEANEFQKNHSTFYFITMAFVSGESLSQRLSRLHNLTLNESLTIQKDLLSGLKYLHEQTPSIVHRDVNTDNLLLSYSDNNIKGLLSDFGLAHMLSKSSVFANTAGRYQDFAPECFWGTYILASDVFSAGIVFYQMITGVHPWQYDYSGIDTSDQEQITTMIITARKILPKKPSSYNNECSSKLDAIILKSISLSLESRYNNATEFYNALMELDLPSEKPISKDGTSIKKPFKEPSGNRENSKIGGFNDIAGMKELKSILYNDVMLPLQDAELYAKYKVSTPNGMLLFGPPGCGKTFIARKFAEEINFNFIELKPSDLASIYVHGTQEKIGQVFTEARVKAPSIIFIDELDAILPNREGDLNHSYASEVNEFLAQMTECHKDGLFIIGATNRPEKIDPAILRTGRLDKAIYIPPPDSEARRALFELSLSDRPVEANLDIAALSDLTANYASSDIVFIVNEASRNALKERVNINQKHIVQSISQNPPSISERQIKKYEIFKNNRSFV